MSREFLAGGEVVSNEVVDIVFQDEFLTSLPRIDEITPVVGGVSHRVFKIISADTFYYLKIRGEHFTQIPQITCNPADIVFEYRALKLFRQISPQNFPEVLSFNPEKFYLVLSDAMPNGRLLENSFLEEAVNSDMLVVFGQTLRRIHDGCRCYRQALRPDGDRVHYAVKLEHRFGYRRHPVLDDLVEILTDQEDKQLILGDVAPKNIGVNNDGCLYIFFDLEEAHLGDPIFDYGYFLGHVLIHTFTSPQTSQAVIEAYQNGYGLHSFEETTVKRIALGTMLYRLRSIIPYPTHLSSEQKMLVEQRAEAILPYQLNNVTWEEIIDILNYGQS